MVGCVSDAVDFGISVVDGVYFGLGVWIDVYVEDVVVPLLNEDVLITIVVDDGSVDADFEVVVVDIGVDDVVVDVTVEDGLDDLGAEVLVIDVSVEDCICNTYSRYYLIYQILGFCAWTEEVGELQLVD